LIEWVDNLRTLRDIVVKLLRERGVAPNVSFIAFLWHTFLQKRLRNMWLT
jgi:hypothetical protein